MDFAFGITPRDVIPRADPKLFALLVLGARFTPIHILLTAILIQFPLLMFLAYRGTLKRWSFEQYIVAKRTDFMPIPPVESLGYSDDDYINLEVALKTIQPLEPEDIQRLEIDDKFLEAIEKNHDSHKPSLPVEPPSPGVPVSPSGLDLCYTPLTTEELARFGEGIEPIIYNVQGKATKHLEEEIVFDKWGKKVTEGHRDNSHS